MATRRSSVQVGLEEEARLVMYLGRPSGEQKAVVTNKASQKIQKENYALKKIDHVTTECLKRDLIFGSQQIYCNCIVTRGGVYDEILPEPEGNPEGGARGIF